MPCGGLFTGVVVVVFVLVLVLVFVVPELLPSELPEPLLLLISLLLVLLVLFILLLPEDELLPEFVPLPLAPEFRLVSIVPLPEPLGFVVSGLAEPPELELPDMLDVESEEELELVVLLPHDAINRPSERLSILIFKIFIVWLFSFTKKTNKIYACKVNMCFVQGKIHPHSFT